MNIFTEQAFLDDKLNRDRIIDSINNYITNPHSILPKLVRQLSDHHYIIANKVMDDIDANIESQHIGYIVDPDTNYKLIIAGRHQCDHDKPKYYFLICKLPNNNKYIITIKIQEGIFDTKVALQK